MSDVHTIDPRPICPGCRQACVRAPATMSIAWCPRCDRVFELEGAPSAVEQLAQEVADLPRSFVATAFQRLEEVLPERRKPLAREVGKAVNESILDFLTKERKTVPR